MEADRAIAPHRFVEDAKCEEARALYQKGLASHQQGSWPQAIFFYQKSLALAPDWAVVQYNLGTVWHQQGRWELAAQAYCKAIALDPHYRQPQENLGCVYLALEQSQDAASIFQEAIKSYPDHASLYNNLGQALAGQGQIDAAIEAYEQAIRRQPDLGIAHLNVGCLWWQMEQYDQAIAHFRQVLSHDPDHLIAHSYCAQVFFLQGNFEQAVDEWRWVADRQSHFLQFYCDRINCINPIKQANGLIGARQCNDLLQQTQVTCVRFLAALVNGASTAEICKRLQDTYDGLGTLLMQDGGFLMAEYYFRQALRITPNHPRLLLKLGQAFAAQDRQDAAIALFHYINHLDRWDSVDRPDTITVDMTVALQKQHQSFTLEHVACTHTWVQNTDVANVHYQPLVWHPEKKPPKTKSDHPPLSPKSQQSTASVSPCGGVTCNTCMTHLQRCFNSYQIQEHIWCCNPPDAIAVESFTPFVVTIPDGQIWIEPRENTWSICSSLAVITSDGTLLEDLSRSYPWQLPGCPYPHSHRHRLYSGQRYYSRQHNDPQGNEQRSGLSVKRLEGRVAGLSTLSGHIYYHWMFDVLPRFGLLRQGNWTWDQIDAFLVNSLKSPFQRETLAILGVPEDKILESDRHPCLQATELVMPSFPGHFDWVPWGTVEFLRSIFLSRVKESVTPPFLTQSSRYLYITRAEANYRRIINEDELIQRLVPLGFEVITLETYSVIEQVALFAHADIVMAPHGAGLTNIVFCRAGAHIIELFSPNYVRTDYWIVSHHVGLNHYWVKGETVGCQTLRQLMYQNPLTEDMWLPPVTIQALVSFVTSLIAVVSLS